MNNIGCFIVGCNKTIIGQCSGYKGNCGQFYCHTHSAGKLCNECCERKYHDEIMQDYLTAARKIRSQKPDMSPIIAGMFIIIGFFGAIGRSGVAFFGWCLMAVPFIIYACVRNQKVKRTVIDTDKIKPGFRKFYQKYEENANK